MASKALVLLWLLVANAMALSTASAQDISVEQLEMLAKTIGNRTWVESFLSEGNLLAGERAAPFSIELNLVDAELRAGESKEYSLNVVNGRETPLVVYLYPSAGFSEFLTLAENILQILPNSSRASNFSISIPKTTAIGVYSGKLYVRSVDWIEDIALDIRVVPSEKPILEAVVTALTKDLEPGKDLALLVEVYNQGRTGSITLDVTHKIVNAKTGQVVATVSEPHNLTTSLLYQKKIPLENAVEGRYIAEVTMKYPGGTISSTEYFSITRPIPLSLIASLLGLAFLSFVAFKVKNYYKKLRMEKARYIPVIDEKALPRKEENSLFVGKIADADIKTYLSLEDLLTHLIIAGGTGYGKSIAAMGIVEGVLQHGIPVIVADPTLQWSGFLTQCKDEEMLKLYADYGMKREEAKQFKGTVIELATSKESIDLREHMRPGEITVLGLNNLPPEGIDEAVFNIISSVFDAHLEESTSLRCLVVFDEVHRLLPKYGGKRAYSRLETAIREFRRWGVGMMLISQVLSDFKAAVHGNIGTEIQMKTTFPGDMTRIEQKYGEAYSRTLTKEAVGVGMIQNSKYNNGLPYFVKFRPLLHNTTRMPEGDLRAYQELLALKRTAESRIRGLKENGVDTRNLEFELRLGVDKLKAGQNSLASIYLKTLNEKLGTGGGVNA